MNTLEQLTVGEYVANDFRTAALFSKYGIDFCCKGNRTIEEACSKKGLDFEEIETKVNQLLETKSENYIDFKSWPSDLLVDYIEKTHHRYVEEKTPILLAFLDKLCKVHGEKHPELFEIHSLFKMSAGDLAQHLKKEEYENEIQQYIQKLGVTNYEIVEKEQGNIPMTCYPFWKNNSKNILNIGAAGGWTKASTGYTFKNTVKNSKALTAFLLKENDLTKFHKIDKFWFYDLLLLDILDRKNHLGSTIFSAMFRKGNPAVIFQFLDEETSFTEDLQVIWRCPKRLFIKALIGRIFR